MKMNYERELAQQIINDFRDMCSATGLELHFDDVDITKNGTKITIRGLTLWEKIKVLLK
jgi:superfamily II DNA/RNA helicase